MCTKSTIIKKINELEVFFFMFSLNKKNIQIINATLLKCVT